MPPSSSLAPDPACLAHRVEGASFWRRPTPWVWLFCTLALAIFAMSMLTWREGQRFQSRALSAAERVVVESALDLWQQWGEEATSLRRVRQLFQSNRLRALELSGNARPQERSAFGYCDEHGRILLNPELCFLYWRSLGSLNEADRVATLATLLHEGHHLQAGSDEAAAYEYEARCLKQLIRWSKRRSVPQLVQELRLWESQIGKRHQLQSPR